MTERKILTLDLGGNVTEETNELLREQIRTVVPQAAISELRDYNELVSATMPMAAPTGEIFDIAKNFLDKYVKDCVRTESKLEELKIDKQKVYLLFEMYTNLGELLDGLKKSVFYSKDTKFEQLYKTNIQNILDIGYILQTSTEENSPILNKNYVVENLDPRVFHGILGIMTESSELAEIVLDQLHDPNKKLDPVNLQEELGDGSGWYTAILHDALNLCMKNTFTKNTDKLKVRFPEKYSHDLAENRQLDVERKILES